MSSLLYFFRESLTGFKRNLSTALGSIITIFLSLLIIGIFCICGVIINNVVTSVENQVSITAYVADDASEQDINAVEQYIQELPGVESVDFTTPYYYASVVTLVKAEGPYADTAGVADLAGATCTRQLNTIWYDTCLPQIPDANILAAAESAPAMLVSLNSNACDIVVTDMPTGKAACVAYPDFVLLDFSGTDGEFQVDDSDINIGISVQKGNTELLDALNGVLKTMTADDFEAMMDEAIEVQPLNA